MDHRSSLGEHIVLEHRLRPAYRRNRPHWPSARGSAGVQEEGPRAIQRAPSASFLIAYRLYFVVNHITVFPSSLVDYHSDVRTLQVVKGGKPERLVSGSDDFTLFLWEPSVSKKPLSRLTGHQQPIPMVWICSLCVLLSISNLSIHSLRCGYLLLTRSVGRFLSRWAIYRVGLV